MPASERKTALVVGGSRGIGAATSRLLGAGGMRVVVNFHSNEADARAVVESIEATGGQARAVRADVRDPEAVHRMVASIAADWEPITVLVNTALIPYPITSFAEMSWEEFHTKLTDEMLAAYTLTKAVVPGMTALGYGRIVHVATNLARNPREGMIALGVAKAALVQFARYTAQELGPSGITVNVVSPGTVDTDIAALLPQSTKDSMAAAAPLRRIAQPEDVANAIAFFADDASSFMTGTNAPVNGGLAMD